MSECSIEWCDKPSRARGWCNGHWKRWRRHGDPLAGGAARVTEKVRWARVAGHVTITPNGCWEYTAARDSNGYGRVTWEGKTYFAHRIAYEELVGAIGDGLAVCHKCDNPPCVNPGHLFAADQAANVADMVAKGRRRHYSKLTVDQVRAIRSDTRMGKVISAEYGVAESTISKIRLRQRWQGVG